MVRPVGVRVILLALGLLGPMASVPALAQEEACAPVVQALAERVLAGRETLPALQAKRFGTRAIFLLSRYGDMSVDDLDLLMGWAVEARLQGAADLDMAWRLHRGTLEPTPEALAGVLDTANPSAARAALLGGGTEAVMAAIAALPEGTRFPLGQMLVTVSFDQPDARKAELGALAEAQGLDWLAAGFAAARQDPAAWPAALEGLPAEEKDMLISAWSWLPGFNGNPIVQRSTAPDDGDARAWAEASGLVAWAASQQPEISLLLTFLNQTGAYAESATVAKLVLKRFDDGLSPSGPLDAGWLATLAALDAQGFDPDEVRTLFGSTSFGLRRAGRENVGDILDWIVAVDALGGFLRGEGPLPAERPRLLSSQFPDWERWRELAGLVQENGAGAMAGAQPDELPVVAELLFATGQRQELVELLEAAPPSAGSVALADDFAARTDRLCDAHLWHRGEAPLLGGQALYAFEDTGR